MIFPCFLLGVFFLVLIDAIQDSNIQHYKNEVETSVAKTYSVIGEITEKKKNSHFQLCRKLEYTRISLVRNKTEDEMEVCDRKNQQSINETLIALQTIGDIYASLIFPDFSSLEKSTEDCFSEALNNLRESLNDAEAETRAYTIHKCLYHDGFRPSCVDNLSNKAAIKERVDCFFMKIALKKITNVMGIMRRLRKKNGTDSCFEESSREIVREYGDPLEEIRICKRKMFESLCSSSTQCISSETVEQERLQMKTCIHNGLEPLDQYENKLSEKTKKCWEKRKM